jgi:hypothetical protein
LEGGGETEVDEEAEPEEVDMLEAPGDLLPSSRLDCNTNDRIIRGGLSTLHYYLSTTMYIGMRCVSKTS